MSDITMEKTEAIQAIAEEIKQCKACPLHLERNNTVPGTGSVSTKLMFIGEGPGLHEDNQGLPFVGASGKFLTQLINKAGFERSEVFITNVVKCRPPNNRDPQPEELAACSHFLERQIALIDPEVIVTLGRFSMARYFPDARISKVHGKAGWREGRLIVPMYHPAAALHQPALRAVVEADFAKLPALIQFSEQKRKELENKSTKPDDDQDIKQLPLF
jgi:uracil-DNA glycosylase